MTLPPEPHPRRLSRNGFAGERIVVNPRREYLDRMETDLTRELEARTLGDAPPGLLDGTPVPLRPSRIHDPDYVRSYTPHDDGLDPYVAALRLQPRQGTKASRATGQGTGRVRVYHRLPEGEAGQPARCWAFTLSRAGWERLLTERILDSEGATLPDGSLVVPPGVDPLDVSVGCGTCGTHSVECLQIEFFEE
jgi:hypothetical protein